MVDADSLRPWPAGRPAVWDEHNAEEAVLLALCQWYNHESYLAVRRVGADLDMLGKRILREFGRGVDDVLSPRRYCQV